MWKRTGRMPSERPAKRKSAFGFRGRFDSASGSDDLRRKCYPGGAWQAAEKPHGASIIQARSEASLSFLRRMFFFTVLLAPILAFSAAPGPDARLFSDLRLRCIGPVPCGPVL